MPAHNHKAAWGTGAACSGIAPGYYTDDDDNVARLAVAGTRNRINRSKCAVQPMVVDIIPMDGDLSISGSIISP